MPPFTMVASFASDPPPSWMFLYGKGYVSAALVLGGVDVTGPHLYNIYPHGSSDKLPYLTMGSGSLAAMSVRPREIVLRAHQYIPLTTNA